MTDKGRYQRYGGKTSRPHKWARELKQQHEWKPQIYAPKILIRELKT